MRRPPGAARTLPWTLDFKCSKSGCVCSGFYHRPAHALCPASLPKHHTHTQSHKHTITHSSTHNHTHSHLHNHTTAGQAGGDEGGEGNGVCQPRRPPLQRARPASRQPGPQPGPQQHQARTRQHGLNRCVCMCVRCATCAGWTRRGADTTASSAVGAAFLGRGSWVC